MKIYILSILILASVGRFDLIAQDTKTSNVLTANSLITVNTTKDWVAGTRLWLAVEIKNTKSNQITGPIREASPFEFYGYSYKLRDLKTGKYVATKNYKIPPLGSVNYNPGGQPEGVEMPLSHKLKSQGVMRLLFPIDWPKNGKILFGDYKLELTIHSIFAELGKSTINISLRQPTKQEILILNALNLVDGHRASIKKNGVNVTLPESLKKSTGLEFELFLSDLSSKNKMVKDIDNDEIPDNMAPIFLPELDLIRYEIFMDKNLANKAMLLRNNLLKIYPGLQFRFDDVDNKNGLLMRIMSRSK